VAFFENRRRHLDLTELHDECERNYRRLQKTAIDSTQLGSKVLLHSQERPTSGLSIEVIEVAKYTSTLNIITEQVGPYWMPKIEVKVRSYRDAKMAEVIEWCSDRTIPWALTETVGRQAVDEKWQWNVFLGEVLAYGLHHGIMASEA